ncbi:NAD(P)-dependent methylenetetrahydromethanopterin dehydrogenase [Aquabacterium sp. OR-4]|uniref:NAD(P)-dependent methylenetetrahydromethanopterin dehydrogenase n=1 Tax=Aquabacterium sp. OR-4 TaxID=2978127 RepID=UPI0021B45A8C|nr:NAD(P)-dependent methylenetetrahydromethanopterin dehydrogenase [Aquabacterium sp. OR-4]MDT7838278.1 NAD(P)-dependent methylenetetrahydromethanopterin dehydrogenase [Aquabacterium sp. OR-4]
MERRHILHLFTPGRQASPFDVNMAADAGYDLVVPYCQVDADGVAAMTQDAIFSRGPKGVARTGIFIGGRDALLAADMLARAQAAMVPPFSVSLMADPSGAYTTAAAMLACVEAALQQRHGQGLAGQQVLVLGGTGPVGRVAAVLAAQAGARVRLASHRGRPHADAAAAETAQRFGVPIDGASTADAAALAEALAGTDLLLACAAAGVQVVDASALQQAVRLKVAADVNAVPPAGIAGVGVMDQQQPLAGSGAVGIGALAIGNVKYQTQHRLLLQMREASRPVVLGFAEALHTARSWLAEQPAAPSR